MSVSLDAIFDKPTVKRVVSGTVSACNADIAVVDTRRGGQVMLPITNWYPNRSLPQVGSFVVVLAEGDGFKPMCSAVGDELLIHLLEGVTPESYDGTVRVVDVARNPGVRSKVSVVSSDARVDAVASFVGRSANRVRSVSAMLAGEQIDIVPWSSNKTVYVSNALAPAAVRSVKLRRDAATVTVDGHQMAAAVGAGGSNVTLASKLTGVDIAVVQS